MSFFAQFVLLSGLKIYFFWQKYTSQTKYFFGSLINRSPWSNQKSAENARSFYLYFLIYTLLICCMTIFIFSKFIDGLILAMLITRTLSRTIVVVFRGYAAWLIWSLQATVMSDGVTQLVRVAMEVSNTLAPCPWVSIGNQHPVPSRAAIPPVAPCSIT